jgi:hypothetical protein
MKFSLLIIFFSHLALSAPVACWTNEINQKTLNPYASEAEYKNDLLNWLNQSSEVNPFMLVRAYQVYVQEKARALTLESDKMSHCYMGCRMRQETNFKTVRYVAWLKEKKDLTDCDPNTHFEVKDFEATILGGALEVPTAADCVTTCRIELPKIL